MSAALVTMVAQLFCFYKTYSLVTDVGGTARPDHGEPKLDIVGIGHVRRCKAVFAVI